MVHVSRSRTGRPSSALLRVIFLLLACPVWKRARTHPIVLLLQQRQGSRGVCTRSSGSWGALHCLRSKHSWLLAHGRVPVGWTRRRAESEHRGIEMLHARRGELRRSFLNLFVVSSSHFCGQQSIVLGWNGLTHDGLHSEPQSLQCG